MCEDKREQLNKLTQEAFLLVSKIAKDEQEFLEKYHVLKKKANKLYEEMDNRLNGT